jgi:hypothetical protein
MLEILLIAIALFEAWSYWYVYLFVNSEEKMHLDSLQVEDFDFLDKPMEVIVHAPLEEEFFYRLLPILAGWVCVGLEGPEIWFINLSAAIVFAWTHPCTLAVRVWMLPSAFLQGAMIIYAVTLWDSVGAVAAYCLCVAWHSGHNALAFDAKLQAYERLAQPDEAALSFYKSFWFKSFGASLPKCS